MFPFQLSYSVPRAEEPLQHTDPVMLYGSCFTEHIGSRMEAAKMRVCNNPQGILFNPESIAAGLKAVMQRRKYSADDVFYLNETWNSWDFHSRFSHTDRELALGAMNRAVAEAGAFLKEARWLVVTFGSAYQYFTTALAGAAGYGVANCHKAPGQWFDKKLLPIPDMLGNWEQLIADLLAYNPSLKLIFTLSPVRHIKDGLIENNRSKARLNELIHSLVERSTACSYFPAYELVTDVLRDYRFYEPDMVHPNSQAAQYVWAQFVQAYMNHDDQNLLQRIAELTKAAQHRHRFPETRAAAAFRESMLHKIDVLEQEFPHLDWQPERAAFAG